VDHCGAWADDAMAAAVPRTPGWKQATQNQLICTFDRG
jgi:hypothetical protein